MNLRLLSNLKYKLIRSQDLGEIWEYFWDHFGEDQNFIVLGRSTRHEFLEKVLKQVARKMFGKRARLTHVMFFRVPKQRFIHGTCRLDGKLSSVMYFEDIRAGCVAVVTSDVESESETQLARFKASSTPRRVSFSMN